MIQSRCRIAALVLTLGLLGSAAPAATYHSYPGAVHIHTTYSDGSGTLPDVAKAAEDAGLAYIITADHDTLRPLQEGQQRYWGRVLVLNSVEISTPSGHFLALDVPPTLDLAKRPAQEAVDTVNAAGGFCVLAHPASRTAAWTDWNVKGYGGIELINLAALMERNLGNVSGRQVPEGEAPSLLPIAMRYLANPGAVMAAFTDDSVDAERARWDALLNAGRQVAATGGVDIHAKVMIGGTEFKVPSYREAFESVQTYVVTQAPLRHELEGDRKEVYGAYRSGRVYLVYPRVAPAPGFRFVAEEAGREATMGEQVTLQQKMRLVAEAPGHPHPVIRLLRNGEEVATAEGERLEWETTTPGVFRAEVYAGVGTDRLLAAANGKPAPTASDVLRARRREVRPWIFSNPIYVRPAPGP